MVRILEAKNIDFFKINFLAICFVGMDGKNKNVTLSDMGGTNTEING